MGITGCSCGRAFFIFRLWTCYDLHRVQCGPPFVARGSVSQIPHAGIAFAHEFITHGIAIELRQT